MTRMNRISPNTWIIRYKGSSWHGRKDYVEGFGDIFYLNGEGQLEGQCIKPCRSLMRAQLAVIQYVEHKIAA